MSLRIKIDNEEVVCDKDFTINKEMLNTPSVILNNVYPKTWEQDKDYISRFYHPNDYSKCLIENVEEIPERPGTTVEGTTLSLDDANTTYRYTYNLKGNTTQSGTPTPDSPVNVNVVTGRQEITIDNTLPNGYTRVDYIESHHTEYIDTGYYPNPNTRIESVFQFTQVESKQQRVFGNVHTDTDGLSLSIYINGSGKFAWACQNGIGNWKATTLNADTNKHEFILDEKNNKFYIDDYEENITTTHTNTAKTTLLLLVYRGATGNIDNNTKAYGKLYSTKVYDNNVLVRDFIPCYRNSDNEVGLYDIVNKVFYTNAGTGTFAKGNVVGNTYEINLGKNLFDKDNANIINGYFDGSHSTITSNANARTLYISCQPNTTYTISKLRNWQFNVACTETEPEINTSIGDTNVNGTINDYDGSTKVSLTYTTNATAKYLLVRYTHVAQVSDEIMLPSIQIEKGSQATSYSAYFTPIELCKIEDYQDYIFHNVVGNEHYDSTLNEGSWYLHKEINKIVLNGSESYSLQNNNRFYLWKSYFNSKTIPKNPVGASTDTNGLYCNRLVETGRSQTWAGTEGISYDNPETDGSTFDISCKSVATTVDGFKTWLTRNSLEIVYLLQNPYTEEITDTELINQLNAVELLDGINNITISSPYLSAIMRLHYNYYEAYEIIDLLFCGVVKNSGKISLNPRHPHYSTLQILDFKDFLSTGETLDYVIYQKTILEAIQQVIETISDYGFVLGNVNLLNPYEIIGAYSTKDKTAYDVFNYIADITQSRWTTRMIDENTVAIDFYDPTLMLEGDSIEYTQEWFREHLIDDISYSYGTNNYRNKQVMTSSNVIGNLQQVQTIYSSGYQNQYSTEISIATINSIYVNGVSVSFATESDKDLGITADFYYSIGNNYVESANIYPAGTEIIISYLPIVEGRQVITNSTEIERVSNSTGRKGIVARYENRNDATTSNELQQIGQSYIKYKGVPEIVLTIQSRANIWEIGQRVQFNAPIEELTTEYMVRSKKINRIATIDTIFYTYEFISSFNSETSINYFDNQRAKANGNISDGQYITRNVDIENTATIYFYDSDVTEVVPVNDNLLNSVLNAPFIE